jgi:GTPase SAR1 family protein
MESLFRLYNDTSPNVLYLLLALISISIIALSYLFHLSRKSKTFVLLGLSASGKTTLFYRLVHSKSVSTTTSQVLNEAPFEKHNLIDLPGHPRLRSMALDHIPIANGIFIVVDSTLVSREIRPLAELFYAVYHSFFILDSDSCECCQEEYSSHGSVYKE